MTNIRFDFQKPIGPIRAMHGVGQPPLLGTDTSRFHYLSDAHIPYARLHDVAGWFGGNMYVDIPNIFRDFDADVNDPASYDFVFTDLLLAALHEHHCEPIFRLGVSIENFHEIKAYRIFPPKDFQKWAEICEHIIRHYNEGWANGFHYNIQYWEIWNEPDGYQTIEGNAMWKGTPEQYYELYRVTSKHLRACFGNTILIGGYASCGFYRAVEKQTVSGEAFGIKKQLTDWDMRIDHFISFFDGFIDMVVKENLPFDFFSHHSYNNVKDTLTMQRYCEERLEAAGLGHVKIQLNEWNANPRAEERATLFACASTAAMMCAMQQTKMDLMCYYDAGIGTSVYRSLFDPLTTKPVCTYYALYAFGKLYELGTQVAASCDNEDVYMTAAVGNGKKGVLIANLGEDTEVTTNFADAAAVYTVTADHTFAPIEADAARFTLKKYQTVYIEGAAV